jgi:hypothetical protein
MSCNGTQYTIPQMMQMAKNAGYAGESQIEIVAHALVESGGCDRAYNDSSQASGILQFLPSTAASVGLSNPFDAQASFDASYKLSGGSNFRDWTPYEPATALDAARTRVRQETGANSPPTGGANLMSSLSGTIAGTGLMKGRKVDSWGIAQGIADTTGRLGGTAKAGGEKYLAGSTVLAGLFVLLVGIGVLAWLFLTRTDTGRGIVKGSKDLGVAAIMVAK